MPSSKSDFDIFDIPAMADAVDLLQLSAVVVARLRNEVDEVEKELTQTRSKADHLEKALDQRKTRLLTAQDRLASAIKTAVGLGVEIRLNH